MWVYNGRMDESTTHVRVTTSRARDHIENIHFRAGDDLVVGRRNLQYPEFVWCATESGLAGWVFEKRLQMTGPGEAIATTDYDAAQLTVVKGEILEVLDRGASWWRCRNAGGVEGWVPAGSLEPAPGS
ncbi:MAG: peptide-binding protein [Actinobacteria bacterium]|nr:peptide-binding protein [Actinomycetota bacterium]